MLIAILLIQVIVVILVADMWRGSTKSFEAILEAMQDIDLAFDTCDECYGRFLHSSLSEGPRDLWLCPKCRAEREVACAAKEGR